MSAGKQGEQSRQHRARIAALTRSRPADDPELIAARRDHAASRLEDHILHTLAAAPPLTPEQRDRLAYLIRGGEGPTLPAAIDTDGATS